MSTRVHYSDHRGKLVSLALLGLAILLAVQVADRDRRVVVLFPPEGFAAALPESARIVATAPMEITLAGGYGLTKALRDAGASIVLPAGRGKCEARTLP